MMKSVILSASALIPIIAAPVPTSGATANPTETQLSQRGRSNNCLIIHGCIWNGSQWVCPDPKIFQDCDAQPDDPPA